LAEQQAAGAAAAWFPALTTMAGLQATWEFLHKLKARGTRVIDELRERSTRSPWGAASNSSILDEHRLQAMEAKYLPA
jgi:hypothetical protein